MNRRILTAILLRLDPRLVSKWILLLLQRSTYQSLDLRLCIIRLTDGDGSQQILKTISTHRGEEASQSVRSKCRQILQFGANPTFDPIYRISHVRHHNMVRVSRVELVSKTDTDFTSDHAIPLKCNENLLSLEQNARSAFRMMAQIKIADFGSICTFCKRLNSIIFFFNRMILKAKETHFVCEAGVSYSKLWICRLIVLPWYTVSPKKFYISRTIIKSLKGSAGS